MKSWLKAESFLVPDSPSHLGLENLSSWSHDLATCCFFDSFHEEIFILENNNIIYSTFFPELRVSIPESVLEGEHVLFIKLSPDRKYFAVQVTINKVVIIDMSGNCLQSVITTKHTSKLAAFARRSSQPCCLLEPFWVVASSSTGNVPSSPTPFASPSVPVNARRQQMASPSTPNSSLVDYSFSSPPPSSSYSTTTSAGSNILLLVTEEFVRIFSFDSASHQLQQLRDYHLSILHYFYLPVASFLLVLDTKFVFHGYFCSKCVVSGQTRTPKLQMAALSNILREQGEESLKNIYVIFPYETISVVFLDSLKGSMLFYALKQSKPGNVQSWNVTSVRHFDLFAPSASFSLSVLDNILIIHNTTDNISMAFEAFSSSTEPLLSPRAILFPRIGTGKMDLLDSVSNLHFVGSDLAIQYNCQHDHLQNSTLQIVKKSQQSHLSPFSSSNSRDIESAASPSSDAFTGFSSPSDERDIHDVVGAADDLYISEARFIPYEQNISSLCSSPNIASCSSEAAAVAASPVSESSLCCTASLWLFRLDMVGIAATWDSNRHQNLLQFLLARNGIQAKKLIFSLLTFLFSKETSLVSFADYFPSINRVLRVAKIEQQEHMSLEAKSSSGDPLAESGQPFSLTEDDGIEQSLDRDSNLVVEEAVLKTRRGFTIISQVEIVKYVFEVVRERQLVSDSFLLCVVTEYLRSLFRAKITPLDTSLLQFLFTLILSTSSFAQLHQLLQYRIFPDSVWLAKLLLEIEHSFPPAFQLSCDMLYRLDALKTLLCLFLQRKMIMPILRALSYSSPLFENEELKPRLFLQAAIDSDSDKGNTQYPTFVSTFLYFRNRNSLLYSSPSFPDDENCQEFVQKYDKLCDKRNKIL